MYVCSQNDSGDLRGVAGGDGKLGCLCGKAGASCVCVMAPPIHLGAWSMALMLWLPIEYYSMSYCMKTHVHSILAI